MNKREKILKLFNEADWITSPSGEPCKVLTADDFASIGLYGIIENSRQHCDAVYARSILQELGYKVTIGTTFCVWESRAMRDAVQQLTGFVHARSGYNLIRLVEEMGLTKKEWSVLRQDKTIAVMLKMADFIDLDNKFNIKR